MLDRSLGDGTAQQSLELRIRDLAHLSGLVVEHLPACIGLGRAGALHGDGGLEADVLAGRAHPQLVAAALDLPTVGVHVPVAVGLIVQRDGNGPALAGGQEDFCKALELLHGAENFCVRLGDVELHDLRARRLARVGDSEGDALFVGLQIAVRKVRVAEAVAEGEGRRDARRLVVAVADVEALTVLHGVSVGAKVGAGRGLVVGVGPGLGQLAAGADFAR